MCGARVCCVEVLNEVEMLVLFLFGLHIHHPPPCFCVGCNCDFELLLAISLRENAEVQLRVWENLPNFMMAFGFHSWADIR